MGLLQPSVPPSLHPPGSPYPPHPPYPSYPAPPEEMAFRELLRKLWRQKLVVAVTAILLTMAAVAVILLIQPQYTAVTRIVIDARQPEYRPIAKSDESTGSYVDGQVIQTQIQIIRSRRVVEQAIARAGLDHSPEFNAALRPPSFLQSFFLKVRKHLDRWLTAAGLPRADFLDAGSGATSSYISARNQIIDAVQEKIDVVPEGLSSVIRITFTSHDPQTSALVANSLAEFYINDQLQAKAKAAKKANDWVNDRLAELRAQVQTSENAVQQYIEQRGLIKTREGTPAAQEIAQMSIELARARADRSVAEARLRQLTMLLKTPGAIESAPEVLGSPLIIHLRQQEGEAQNKAAELSQRYGDLNPKMLDVQAAIRDIQDKIKAEAERITEGVRNDVAVARAREASLSERLDESKKEVGKQDSEEVKLRPLQREAEATRHLFEEFLMRSKQIVDQAQNSDAHVLTEAAMPDRPSFPRRRPLILLSAVASLFMGILVAFWVDHLDPGFRSLEQAKSYLGLRPLALVPALGGLKVGRKIAPAAYMLSKPRSSYGEAMRTLIVSMTERGRDNRRARIILVCSSLPNEGKTSLALSLARLLAASRQRVLVVDCDLRKPSAHRLFEVENSPGLTEYLMGDAKMEDILREDAHSSAALIPAGEHDSNPTMLLGSTRMRSLMRMVANEYDWIILDSSPVMAVADARLVAKFADKTIFAVRWAKTRRETALLAVTSLAEAGADIAGVVLTRVDVKKHPQYSYGDPGYHKNGVARYYMG